MNDVVSKSRRRQTRHREKQAGRAAHANRAFKDSALLGFLYALGCWFLSLLVFAAPLHAIEPTSANLLSLAGKAIAVAIVLLCFRVLASVAAPEALRRNSRFLLISLVIFLSLAAARFAQHLHSELALLPSLDSALFLVPYSFAPIVITLLFGGTLAILVGIVLGVMTAFLWNGDMVVLMLALLATVTAAHETGKARTRSRVLRIGLMIGCIQFSGLFLQMTQQSGFAASDVSEIAMRAVFSLGGALIGAVAAVLILPPFEHLFGITSDITLMSFADLGHPLLQRLALEAPGTYHHCMVVASLAQTAADRIGANGLLARVTSYYHDIGKLHKPRFFIENNNLHSNPHDDLPPNISRMIIANHVKEGISLALLHKLPLPVLDVIREHHGTSVISCFHHKAREMLNRGEAGAAEETPGEKVDESHFRYSGPTPSSRESGIINLADSVEAASRSIEKATPTHIEGLVSSIFERKLLDGQLDHSSLTLHELNLVKQSFITTLTSMLHARIAYPDYENNDKQSAKKTKPEPEGNS